jgi:hypothetical protein
MDLASVIVVHVEAVVYNITQLWILKDSVKVINNYCASLLKVLNRLLIS